MQAGVIEELQNRGFVFQVTETGLDEVSRKQKLIVYAGFDPTAPSLHLGHVIPIMGLAHFQRYGHQPIVVIGGATALIGDPSGKQSERTLQPKETILSNAERIRSQLTHFLELSGENAAIIVNNADWLGDLSLIDFLRDTGKHFSLGALLNKESIRSRIDREQGISITEFLYLLLQSFDYKFLNQTYNCNLQIGGSDQWGNITAGIEFIKKTTAESVHGLTFPLLTKSDGGKFGKTESGAIWLDPGLTSPYEMYQYWVNTDDRDVIRFLKFFTFLSLNEISDLEMQMQLNLEMRTAQKKLAWEFTKMVHGEKAAKAARMASDLLFGNEVDELDEDALSYLKKVVPFTQVEMSQFHQTFSLLDALVLVGMSKSKGEARRLINQGGAYINNKKCETDILLGPKKFLFNKAILLRAGKKKYHLLIVEDKSNI